MTRQLDELRDWISSLKPRQRLFENQPEDSDLVCLDKSTTDDLKA